MPPRLQSATMRHVRGGSSGEGCERGRRGWTRPLTASVLLSSLLLSGCSLEKLAVRKLGQAMAASGDVYAGDDDPELVAGALPFALKTIEGLLASDPGNRDLLLASARGFTQYAYAFV